MRNILFAVLGVVIAVLLYQQHKQSVALDRLQQAAAISVAPPSLDVQERCAKQAAVEFEREGLKDKEFAEFTSHYSVKLGRCFTKTQNTEASKAGSSTQRLVVDAFEGKVYGTYLWMNFQGKKYWEVSPTECSFTMPSGEEKSCQSDDEWNELAKTYMDAP